VRGSNFGCGWKNRRSYCVLIERVGHQPPKLQNVETSGLFYRLFVAFRFKFTLSLAFAFWPLLGTVFYFKFKVLHQSLIAFLSVFEIELWSKSVAF